MYRYAKTCLDPSWRALKLLALLSIVLCVLVVYAATWSSEERLLRLLPASIHGTQKPMFPSLTDVGKGISSKLSGVDHNAPTKHPIEQLISIAEKEFQAKLGTQATSLEDAAAKYRSRRGRHPPPGFNEWYGFAAENGVVMVEEFWDQICHDLGPFWGMEPHRSRVQAHNLLQKISIRGGVVNTTATGGHVRLEQWMDMLQTLASHPQVHLPDVDIPLNTNDEPAMLVPWEIIDTALSIARPVSLSPTEILNEYSGLKELDKQNPVNFEPGWLDSGLTHSSNARLHLGPRPFWSLIRPACSPDSSVRLSPIFYDIWHPQAHTSAEHSAASMLPMDLRNLTLDGYVSNWTIATNLCEYPDLQGLHGAIVAPKEMSVTTTLFPLFSASKMSTSNEILLPSPFHWNTSTEPPFSPSWSQRVTKICWHGPASGGQSTAHNWRRLHRHRFVSMLNATQLEVAEANLHVGNESTIGLAHSENFRLLPGNDYKLETENGGRMAQWVAGWADVQFTDLKCDDGCNSMGEFYSIPATLHENNGDLKEEQEKCKYTAVPDGDSGDSDDTLHHLNSGTVVLKASVYRQWYDARLVPWLHFIPMDNTFVDLYGIMEFFLGTATSPTSTSFSHLNIDVPVHEHHFHDTNNEINKRTKQTFTGGSKKKREEDGVNDAKAEKIAQAGKEWADKVLRREDMLVYMYRLVLEYARVLDDRRDGLGWVGDLLAEDERR